MFHRQATAYLYSQVLREAHDIDSKYDNGTDIKPLCGLLFAAKDLYDVKGYHTVAGTPALNSKLSNSLQSRTQQCSPFTVHALQDAGVLAPVILYISVLCHHWQNIH